MEAEKFFQKLQESKSSVFPIGTQDGQFHMDLESKIYVFLQNSWQEVETISFNDEHKIELS
jgi:hypothetical protein